MTARLDVMGVILLVAAIVVGVWLGLGGPDVSPIFTQAPGQDGGGGVFRR
jgi:hypothetical protein